MAKKGKVKVSRVKRNNQTTNKMKKQGKMKLQRHRAKAQKQNVPQPAQAQVEYSSESEGSGDEWGDMLDEEEKQYIMSRLAKNPGFLADVPEKEDQNKSNRKRKKVDKEKVPKRKRGSDSGAESDSGSESEFEDKYEQEMADKRVKRMRALLPIKTKQGLMERTEEYEDTESEQEDQHESRPEPQKVDKPEDDDSQSDSDSGMEGTGEEDTPQEGGVVSTVELMAARRDRLNHEKLRIGALCSSLLEEPEKKLKNLYPILYLMEERLKDNTLNLHSVRKIATLSAYEVFKDVLPEYQIRHQDYSNIKLKKDTLTLYKYEKELLEFYKRYLQRLEKACAILRPKKGDTRKPEESAVSLALISLRCMCGLLVARPHFNYATNIAQSVIPFLDSRLSEAGDIATEACVTVFQEDTRGDITLTVVRLINQLVKRREERLRPTALRCLLSLKIRDVDLDAEADVQHKKKQEERHKKRIVNLSKKEKKRAKKLKEVERELLETEAQESEVSRRKQLTEVTKTVFHIYFRLLKSAPRSKLLAAALDGLAKFTHVINLEYYSDLVAILSRLMSDEVIAARERLLCARCVLAILAGSGDSINVDPGGFHAALYAAMLKAHAGNMSLSILPRLMSDEVIAARERLLCARCVLAILAGSGDSINVDPGGFHAALYAAMLKAHAGNMSLSILPRLMSDEVIAARERLLCARCVLAILAGSGDSINVDPGGFHAALYAAMLKAHAGNMSLSILPRLMSDEVIAARERLLCARCVLAILAGSGDSINVDPGGFHAALYAAMLKAHAGNMSLSILPRLMSDEVIAARERLLCARCVLAILAGSGDSINVDPGGFHAALYAAMLKAHAGNMSLSILPRLMSDEVIAARERLLCARCVLAILAGSGDSINVDPGGFHAALYAAMLKAHAGNMSLSILPRLMSDEVIAARERLLCARCVLAILAGSGDSINVDPGGFHAALYAAMLKAHAGNMSLSILPRLMSDEVIAARERLLCARCVLAILAGSGDSINVDPGGFHAALYAAMLKAHAGNMSLSILPRLMSDEVIAARERLLCARCVLAILAGSGDSINVDPGGFHAALYAAMLKAHAGATHSDARIVLEAVCQVCARARRVSADELAAFAKRLATLALQLQHNGALACLALLHTLAQQSKAVEALFELDPESGAGRFDPALEAPAHAHARAAALTELCALRRHYHPAVRQAVDKYDSKLSPVQLFDQYDGSQMAFKPAVPPPKPAARAKVGAAHAWAQPDLRQLCEQIEDSVDLRSVSVELLKR